MSGFIRLNLAAAAVTPDQREQHTAETAAWVKELNTLELAPDEADPAANAQLLADQ